MLSRIRKSRSTNLLAEILMIVIGINVALWFEGLAESWQESEMEQAYLLGLYEDLQSDLEQLNDVIPNNEAKIADLKRLIRQLPDLADASSERQGETLFTPSSYWFFEPADVTLTSMRESGDFRLLSDQEVKRGLLRLVRHYRQIEVLQSNFVQALDDGYIPLLMSGFDLKESRITDPGLLDNQLFRNFFLFTLQDTHTRNEALKQAKDLAQQLALTIESQIES